MKQKQTPQGGGARLRRQAEERLQAQQKPARPTGHRQRTEADTERLLHELQVYQTELEMQNEELKAAREELDQALADYTELYDFAPAGYLTLQSDGVIQRANLAAATLLGIARSRLLKRRFALFVSPGGRLAFNALLTRAFESKSLAEADVLLQAGGRPPLTVHLRAAVTEEGRECRVVLTDITERKAAENALRETNARLASVFEGTRDAIFIADTATGRIVDANPEAARLLGRSRESILGMHQSELHPPQESERYRQQFSRRAGQTAPSHAEGEVWTSDGRRVPVEISASTITLAGGQRAVVGVFRDITERKLADKRRQQDAERTELLLNLHQRAPHLTDRELYDYVLEKAVALTDSTIGFFHEVSEDQKTIILTTWNQEALKNCTASFDSHYPLGEAGNWVDCVRQQRPIVYNDFARSPNQKGLPPGHAPVRRFMSIPVVEAGKVRIIFGVGNKAEDYDEGDVAQLQLVANELHKLMAQRRAEDALRKSEERYRRIVETAREGVWTMDREHRTTLVNDQMTRMLGYEPGEIIGRAVEEFMFGEDLPAHRERMARRHEGQGAAYEHRFRRSDGSELWTIVSATALTDPAGQFDGSFAMFTDITERKQAEEARRESEANLRALLAASTQSVLLLDVRGAVIEINEIGAQRLGRRREELLGADVYDHLPPEMVAPRRARLAQVVSSGQPLRFEDSRSGRVLNQHLVPIFSEAGQVVRVAVFAEDITERKQMEEELRHSERLFRLAFEESPVGRCLVEVDGRIGKTNHAFCALLGRSEHALGGLNFLEVTHPEDRKASAEGVRQLLEGTINRLDLEKRYLTSEQQTVWASVRVGLLRDHAGAPRHFSVYIQDISERKQAEAALRASEEKYRCLVENAQEAIYVVQDLKLRFVNRMCSILSGRSEEELRGATILNLVPDAEQGRLRAHHQQVLATESALPPQEFALVTRSGKTRWLRVNAVRIEWEGQPATLNFASDITQQKHADDQFRIQHELVLSLAGAADLAAGIRICLEAALATAGLDAGGFYLRDDRSGALEFVEPRGLTPEFIRVVSRYEADSDRARLVLSGQPVYAPLVAAGLSHSVAVVQEGLRFLAVIPLRHEGAVIGCLNVASHALDDLAPEDRRALETIAATATQAIVRLRAEERLRASETLLNETQRLSQVGGWEWDVARQRMLWTEETYRIHDLSAQDFAPGSDEHIRRSAACYAPEYQAVILAAFRRCTERGEAYDLEVPFTSVQGRSMWVRTTAQAVWEDNRIVRVVGNLMDITERKQAEAALQESEERLRLALRATNDVIWDWDVVRDLQRWNEAGTAVFGWSDIVAAPQPAAWWTDRVHPEDHQRVAEGFHTAVRNPACQHWQDEYRFRKADGTYAFVLDRGYILRSQDGHARRMIGAMLDITDRKQAEAALRESEEFRKVIFDSMAAHIAVVSQAGVILAVNAPWERFRNENPPAEGNPARKCGLGADYVEVCRCSARQGAEGAMTACEGIRSVLAGQAASFTMEYPCHSPTEQRWFSMMVTPLGGGQRGAVVSHTNITELKKAEQSLAASKARLEAVFRVAPTGVGVVVDRVLQEVNERILEMTGYLREELIGVNSRLLYPTEEDFLYVGREKYRQITERGTGTVESRWRRKDGAIRDVLLSSTPLDPANHSRGVVFTALDITERRRLEAVARENSERLSLAIRGADLGTWDWDLLSDKVVFNARWAEMLGYTLEQIPPHVSAWEKFIHPADQEAIRRELQAHFDGHTDFYETEHRLRHRSAEWVWVLDKGKVIERDASGRPVRMCGTHLDITNRKQAEEALRKLSQAVEQSPASVMITDLEGNTEYVNGRFSELTGYSSAEILGQNPRILQSGQTPAETYRQLWAAITRGEAWDGEMLNRKKNGELFWERALISPIKDAGGRITHYLGIKEDITERKRAEAELRASREQLRALAASLTQAEQRERRRIATLLHDDVIQSLALTRIKIGALRVQLTLAEQKTLLDTIRTHLESAITSTRSMTFQLSPPILHELGLEAALGWLAEQFTSEHGVQFEFVADTPPVSLDEETRNLLFTAVRELLLNVVKHARATRARVTTQMEGGSLCVVVEDDGVGWQPDSTARPDVKTGGFGLFSIRERLSYLGGHCEVQAAPARGTRVTLTMPLKQT